jgi:hypothetical protein
MILKGIKFEYQSLKNGTLKYLYGFCIGEIDLIAALNHTVR